MTDPDKQGERGQLSDSARPEQDHQPASQAPGEDGDAGKHGRPSDDSDPGHS
ncbi:hypothetical protein [Deinococcus petrolearius]|uniref:Uncharacterized protein n=1 Tax=Deinococcus petrolearius TaxID=1751295 RepID=A0ABW1DFL1_9DEIO